MAKAKKEEGLEGLDEQPEQAQADASSPPAPTLLEVQVVPGPGGDLHQREIPTFKPDASGHPGAVVYTKIPTAHLVADLHPRHIERLQADPHLKLSYS